MKRLYVVRDLKGKYYAGGKFTPSGPQWSKDISEAKLYEVAMAAKSSRGRVDPKARVVMLCIEEAVVRE